jgi:drug/metabolite transporter (DMT)-like permease
MRRQSSGSRTARRDYLSPVPNASPRPSRARILAAFAVVYLVWGSTYLAIRYAIMSLPPLLMAGARFLVAGAALYAWLRLRGRARRPTRGEWQWAGLAGVLMLACGNGAVVWAEQRVSSGVVALVVASVALWVVVIEWVRPGGRRPGALVATGVVLGLVGIGVLVGPGQLGTGGVDPLAAAVLGLASLSWAGGSLLARGPRMPRPTLLGAAMQMLVGGGALLVAGLLGGDLARLDLHRVTGVSLAALGYLVVFGSLIGYSTFVWLVSNVAPARAATYAYVNPVVAVVLGWAIAGERIDARTLVASAIIVAAVALVTVGQAPRRDAAPSARDAGGRRDAAA